MNLTRVEDYHPIEPGLISDVVYNVIDHALGYIMFIVSSVGVVTNTINIRTFIIMGLRDGVSISLLGLSISDLGVTSFGCVLSSSLIIGALERRYDLKNLPIQPMAVAMFSANISFIFYQVTCLTTMFLGVARCMCVAMPFKFKNAFTRRRSIFAQIVFVFFGITLYVPVISQMDTRRGFDPVVNKTRLIVWFSSRRSEFKDVTSFIHFFIVVFVSTFVVFICVLVMAKYLRQSVKFRNLSSSSGKTGNDASGKDGNDTKYTSANKLSGKELQVVKQVVVICSIYTACMVPSIIFTIYRMTDADFDVGKRLQNFYLMSSSTGVILSIANSATTFPVYFVYNSKFRSLVCSNSREVKKTMDTKSNG